jgi:hypothetical protein
MEFGCFVTTVSDAQLFELVHQGAIEGLAGLYDRHGAACVKVAQAVGAIGVDSEDLVFDLFMTLWRNPPAAGSRSRNFLLQETILAASQAGRTTPSLTSGSLRSVRDW